MICATTLLRNTEQHFASCKNNKNKKKMEYSNSTDKRFISAGRSAGQRVTLPEIVTDYLAT
jgi:hypothetical protein